MNTLEVVLLLVVALAAGWLDAVVGGGGLLQLPVLIIALPGVPVATALGTHKLVGLAGLAAATATYMRRIKLDPRIILPTGVVAVACAALGAVFATAMPVAYFRPMIIVALLVVALVVTARPRLGQAQETIKLTAVRRVSVTLSCGCTIGFYDGLIGPGTGTFLVISFMTLLGTNYVHSSALAKFVNTATNLGALVVFATQGNVLWLLGSAMAMCSIAGGWLGARTAITRGPGFIRIVLLSVVLMLLTKLAWDQFGLSS
jgi:uncharacterized membrane protein YfcA